MEPNQNTASGLGEQFPLVNPPARNLGVCRRCAVAIDAEAGFCAGCRLRNLEEAQLMEARGEIRPIQSMETR